MFSSKMKNVLCRRVLAAAAILGSGWSIAAADSAGAVYTMTNAASGNAVVAYERSADGTISRPQTFPTGGAGLGAGLGSQGALALSEDGHWLLAVNAGSNDVTVFSAGEDGLVSRSRTASGGTMPISVTMRGGVVFVLNAGGSANISG